MRLSYSSISTYQTCPLQYKLRYIDKLPTKPSAALSFGSSLHSALEFMYSISVPVAPALEEVLKVLGEKWEKEGYADKNEEKTYFQHAKQILTTYYQTNIDSFALPAAVEQRFDILMNGINFTGVIDRLDKIGEGAYEVIDYKTNRKLPPLSRVEKDLQLTFYHLAVEKIWGFTPKKLSLYYLMPNQKMSSVRTTGQVKEAKELIKRVADKIDKGNFKAQENALCPWCDFQRYCPYFKHQFTEIKLPQEKLIDIKKAVDEYGQLKEQEKKLKEKIAALAEDIKTYCNKNDLNRLYTELYEIVRRETEKVDYDEDKLKEILKEAGLLDKVLAIDKKLLKELIEDGVDEKVRESLKTAENVSTTYSLYCKKRKG